MKKGRYAPPEAPERHRGNIVKKDQPVPELFAIYNNPAGFRDHS